LDLSESGTKQKNREMHSEELLNLYCLLSVIRVIKSRKIGWVGHVAHMRNVRNSRKISVEKPEWKRPLGRPKPRGNNGNRMDL